MRSISFSVTALLALLSSAALAQQSPETTGGRPSGDTIGHPPPLPGPPPISEPSSTTQPAPAASTPRASEPAPKGYTGAYAPAGTPPTPYSTGPLPKEDSGPGRDVVGPDGHAAQPPERLTARLPALGFQRRARKRRSEEGRAAKQKDRPKAVSVLFVQISSARGFTSNCTPSTVSTFRIVLNFGSASPRSDL